LHRQRWPDLDAVLDELLELSGNEREARLSELAKADPGLHRAATEMLAAGADGDSFLEGGAQALAGEQLEDLVSQARRRDVSTGKEARLGPYRLLERLGAGGMGEVWLAERDDDVMRQKVAIKILKPLAGSEGTQRFRSERQILAALRHDGIAKVLDAGAEPGSSPYLVLEYVEGSEITEYCRDRDLDLEARLDLFLGVCDAVGYAHQRFIVHRDLKPSNVLVTHSGRVKLVDFGIAKLLDPGAIALSEAPLTRTGLFLMTPDYAAPEQILGRTITTATDVYGLGVLLYELLTGERPFDLGGRTASEIERIVCHTEAERPSAGGRGDARARFSAGSWRKRLRGDLDTIILKAMRKEPEERYATVQDLGDDIRRFTEGRPVAARPASLGYRAGKFVRRHRLVVAASTLVVTASIAGLAGTLWQARQAELQKARFDSTGEFLFTLFEQVDPDLHPGAQLTAVGLLDIGSAQLEKFAAGPEARVDLLRVLGVLYSKLGDRERGEALLRQAVVEARETLAPENETIGQALDSLGKLLAERGKLAESELTLRESIAAFVVAGETGNWPLGAGRDLALTHLLQGRWRDAETALKENVADHEPFLASDPRNLTHRSLAAALALLGELRTDLGQWEAARESLERSAAIARERLGEKHPGLAQGLERLGDLQARLGDLPGSESHYREALAVGREAYPAGHHTVARILSRLAAVRARQGDGTSAQRYYREALQLWEGLPEGTHSERADRTGASAELQQLQGAPDLARSTQRTALEARRLAHGLADHWRVAEDHHRLGLIELSAGRYDEAGVELERAFKMRRDLFGEVHSSVGDSLTALGRLRRRQGRPDEAAQLFERALSIQAAALPDKHPTVQELERERIGDA
jgi:serine/threonine-protein kinase